MRQYRKLIMRPAYSAIRNQQAGGKSETTKNQNTMWCFDDGAESAT